MRTCVAITSRNDDQLYALFWSLDHLGPWNEDTKQLDPAIYDEAWEAYEVLLSSAGAGVNRLELPEGLPVGQYHVQVRRREPGNMFPLVSDRVLAVVDIELLPGAIVDIKPVQYLPLEC